MSEHHPRTMDLSTPPVIKLIGQRSLVIGAVFSVIAGIGAFFQPQVFFRGYLVSYMDWLGITLGSMAILMLRHLTGGGWGMVIRRILGAAMRCLPLMAALFLPIIFFGIPKLYIWAQPIDTIADPKLRDHLREITAVKEIKRTRFQSNIKTH